LIDPSKLVNQLANFPIDQIGDKNDHKKYFRVKDYYAKTTQGNFRNYNEDRVSIIRNIVNQCKLPQKPDYLNPIDKASPSLEKENNCPNKSTTGMLFSNPDSELSYFALFDGHAGEGCCDFLRDNMHLILT